MGCLLDPMIAYKKPLVKELLSFVVVRKQHVAENLQVQCAAATTLFFTVRTATVGNVRVMNACLSKEIRD